MFMRSAGRFGTLLIMGAALCLGAPALALDDGYGPDAWQVIDVAPNDVLNMRMGPGTNYPVIGSFAHNARGLQQVTCVPLMTFEQSMAMSDAQRAALPPRWCLITDADRQARGWVNARFLAEDGSTPIAGEASPSQVEPVPASGDALLQEAEALVRELYSAQAMSWRGVGQSPLLLPRGADFFSTEVQATLAAGGPGADPIYDAQDADISNLRIGLDPDEPMFRGMITVHADFNNFGRPTRATYRLRPDPGQPGAPLRIFRIDLEGWSFQ